MSAQLIILDPSAPEPLGNQLQRRPLNGLEGKAIGFIDNSKPNFSHLVDDLAELMQIHHGIRLVVKHRKRAPGVAAADEVLQDLAEKCDVVITGSGD